MVPSRRAGSDLAKNSCLICPGLIQSNTHPLTPPKIQIPKNVIFDRGKIDGVIEFQFREAAERKLKTSRISKDTPPPRLIL